jgi:signal transduction histidine kinase
MALPVQIPTEGNQVMVNSVMTLSVISDNQDIIKLCREVLRDLGDSPYDQQTKGHSQQVPNCEVCLWDYEPDEPMPAPHRAGSPKVFYLVHPADLESLQARMPAAAGNILLKPVTRAILQAFLGSVAVVRNEARRIEDAIAEVGAIRAVRDEILQSLLHANLRLQEYDQQRTNFIARAVHDFRAPLTALSGYCGLLAAEELGPLNERQKEALQRMNHSTKRLSRMASAMFDLSLGPRVSPELQLREGDILERIRQALHEILPLAREKQISMSSEGVVAPSAPLFFDPSQIEQVLINLLDNACKFTPRNGSIEVRGYPYFWERRFLKGKAGSPERRLSGSQSPNSYRVDVADAGPGVPRERREHIFEEYTSYCGPQDRSGGGLGLAICRLILSRHQGHIWVESRREGAVFAFVIPYRRSEAQGNIPRPSNT